MKKVSILVLASFLMIGFAGYAGAAIVNGDFETGNLGGWMTTGSTSIEDAGFGTGPSEGTYQAFMSSGTGSVDADALATFLGLSLAELNAGVGSPVIEGSAIKQTITVVADEEIFFDWNFLTNENDPLNGPPITTFDGGVFVTAGSKVILADKESGLLGSSTTGFFQETGYLTSSYTALSDGTLTIGFGVYDVLFNDVDSGLLLDNIRRELPTTVPPNPPGPGQAVPEPGTIMLLGFGLLGFARVSRRKL